MFYHLLVDLTWDQQMTWLPHLLWKQNLDLIQLGFCASIVFLRTCRTFISRRNTNFTLVWKENHGRRSNSPLCFCPQLRSEALVVVSGSGLAGHQEWDGYSPCPWSICAWCPWSTDSSCSPLLLSLPHSLDGIHVTILSRLWFSLLIEHLFYHIFLFHSSCHCCASQSEYPTSPLFYYPSTNINSSPWLCRHIEGLRGYRNAQETFAVVLFFFLFIYWD